MDNNNNNQTEPVFSQPTPNMAGNAPMPPVQPPQATFQPSMTTTPMMSPAPQPMQATFQPSPAYNNLPPQQPVKSKKTGLIIAIAVISFVIALIVTTIILMPKGSTGSGGGGSVEKTKTVSVSTGNATYDVPVDYDYKVQENQLVMADQDGSWMAMVAASEGVYSNISLSKVRAYFTSQGHVVKEVKKATHAGREYIEVDLTIKSERGILAYSRADGAKAFTIGLQKEDGTVDFNFLDNITPILDSASFSATKSLNSGSMFESFPAVNNLSE